MGSTSWYIPRVTKSVRQGDVSGRWWQSDNHPDLNHAKIPFDKFHLKKTTVCKSMDIIFSVFSSCFSIILQICGLLQNLKSLCLLVCPTYLWIHWPRLLSGFKPSSKNFLPGTLSAQLQFHGLSFTHERIPVVCRVKFGAVTYRLILCTVFVNYPSASDKTLDFINFNLQSPHTGLEILCPTHLLTGQVMFLVFTFISVERWIFQLGLYIK